MLAPIDDRRHLGTEEEFAAELAEFAREEAPSRFSVLLVEGERLDAVIIGWGLAHQDGVLVCLTSPDGADRRAFMTFPSVGQMRRRLCRDDAVRLVWVDAVPLAEGQP